jgi:hypothetical protein
VAAQKSLDLEMSKPDECVLDERSYDDEWPQDAPENLSKEEVRAFDGPMDYDVACDASVVQDEVIMINTCVPSRTRG